MVELIYQNASLSVIKLEYGTKEDVQDMCKGYKVGDPLTFTATLNAAMDPEKASQQPAAVEDEDEGADDEE